MTGPGVAEPLVFVAKRCAADARFRASLYGRHRTTGRRERGREAIGRGPAQRARTEREKTRRRGAAEAAGSRGSSTGEGRGRETRGGRGGNGDACRGRPTGANVTDGGHGALRTHAPDVLVHLPPPSLSPSSPRAAHISLRPRATPRPLPTVRAPGPASLPGNVYARAPADPDEQPRLQVPRLHPERTLLSWERS